MMTNAERKVKFKKGLSSLYLPIYEFLCEELPPEWAPYQGFRSVAEQDALYQMGRTRAGNKVTWAQGGQSPHNYGCASDWTIFEGGKPLWMPISDLRWRTYQQAIEKIGARWGGDWNRNGDYRDERYQDGYHNELLIDCSWKHVFLEFTKNGMRAAQEFIEERMVKPHVLRQTSK
jgi:D-alanyl-D-alanine carboxypeptidase